MGGERIPDMVVERIVAVVGTPGADPYLIEWLDIWAQPIKLDPKWNGGNYYPTKSRRSMD